MSSTENGYVSVSISAGTIEATGHGSPESGFQLVMGKSTMSFIHIKPDVARQWIGVLETIAEPAA